MSDLALFAGTGRLPALLLDAGPAEIVGFAGAEPEIPVTLPARFERLGELFDTLKARGVARICMAGAMQRPQLDPTQLDPFTASKVPQLMSAMQAGDDGLLRVVIDLIESAGLTIVAAHEIRPDLVAQAGLIAGAPESCGLMAQDIRRARTVLETLSSLDIGQGVVVAGAQVVGIETLQGTAAMLDFVATTKAGTGGLFMKRAKRGQDLRVDMPAIGPQTIEQAARAGVSGIEIAAGEVLLLDREEIMAACDRLNIALWASD